MSLNKIYGRSLGLLTDLYQLTMAQGYWMHKVAGREAVFHLFYRRNPFGGGYAVACGLGDVVDWLANLRFDESDTNYLKSLCGADGQPLFETKFLDYLHDFRFECDVDAMQEGTVVFENEPLIRVSGPIIQCQLIETGLLAIVNYQTLVATKAARIRQATGGEDVLEFGLRRAPGIDGLAASRATYIGGCAATSNVLAGKVYGIPVRGTHAHSWVMSFEDELAAFDAYAEAMPNNCVFLVDTYDTIQGVAKAIHVGHKLRKRGYQMIGVRLDSGDLADLSIQARQMLDDAGFLDASIVASNDLDEYEILKLKAAGATINVWGVGTRLTTAYDQPALGGVYKLSAIRDNQDEWDYRIKLSDDPIKVSNPGILQVRRFRESNVFCGDVLYNEQTGIEENPNLVFNDGRQIDSVGESTSYDDLLVPIFRQGELRYDVPSLNSSRERTVQQMMLLPDHLRQIQNDKQAEYPIVLEKQLAELKQQLIQQARRVN